MSTPADSLRSDSWLSFIQLVKQCLTLKRSKSTDLDFQSSPSGYIYMPTNQFNQQNENSNKPPQGQTSGFFHQIALFILMYASISNSHTKR